MSATKGVPLAKDEVALLIDLVKANKVITSKATNATNNQLKLAAWNRVTDAFNALISSNPRRTDQLKLKWENLKKSARKRSKLRMNQKTDGGKPDYIPPDDTLDRVTSILDAACEDNSVSLGEDAEVTVDSEVLSDSGGPDMVTDSVEDNVFHKLWYLLRTYLLILKTFDLFLQGAFLITILLESNIFLLLRRDANEGYHSALAEDYVRLGAAGAEFILGAAVAWWGRGRRQLAISGWLAASSAAGLMVLAFPFSKSNPASVELCGEETVTDFAEDNNVAARTAFLVMTAVLCTITKLSVWAHGLTYLDDHDPQNGPYFYGILISIRLSLGLSGTNWLRAVSKREDWWEAHLSLCMLTFMFAFLLALFPTRMSTFTGLDERRDSDVDNGFFSSVSRVVRNKALMAQSLALSCLSAAVLVYVHYDTAYVQARYRIESIRQDPRTSRVLSDIFRTLVIIFFVMIFRVRFSARRPEGVKTNTASRVAGVIAIFVATFFIILAVIGCDTGTFSGLQTGTYVQPACSRTCGCVSERYGYSPVCSLDSGTTYFSPCHAGCPKYEDLNGFLLFQDCACSTGTKRAVRGSCTLSSCVLAYSIYQVVYTIMLAVSAASFLMQGMAVIRAVRPADKVTAVGTSLSVVALLSFIIGHVIYMLISHQTCVYFSNGACLLHAPTLWIACATSALLAAMAAIGSLVASRMPAATHEPTTEL